ncbi:uncharacterized protein PV09_09191 [Verruconis gallopava]|uniref:Uncharacterized protein n=1 Tax=Verruconis gallopava TaxID=253628 RepID=A0A0D1ZXB5_9PEZI|nr:uncharacterized protein PV09_09191 [Verruconis gallopava]KIV99087.1 hypothetical protein PV09_09191 [Verruconis gallopava]
MSSPVWLITATSGGFGRQIALEVLRRNHQVIATARDVSKVEDLKSAGADTASLDVTDKLENIQRTVSEAVSKFGRIDYLVNIAGYILEGAAEEASPEETLQLFNTNFFGTLNVTRAVLPYMRAQRSGTIALFGSLASWRSGPAYSLYSATKWACSGIAEGLRAETAPFGITVTVIEPGVFRTGFLDPGAKLKTRSQLKDYDETAVGQVRQALNKPNKHQPGDVVKGSLVIVDILTRSGVAAGREVPERIVLGSDCEQAIRKKCTDTLALLDEWKDIFTSTDN